MSIQTSYSETMAVALPGLVKGCDNDIITRICETAAGIGFGLAVSQGTGDQGAIIGGTAAGFLGATIRDVTLESDQSDTYDQYQNMGVLKRGTIWVTVDHAVDVGDAVYFIAGTGKFTNQSGGNQGPMKGARFASTAEDEALAILELPGYLKNT